VARGGSGSDAATEHWAFHPSAGWAAESKRFLLVRSPIDAFVLARLEARGVTFSEDADRRTLIRRLHLDLIGLPPEPAAVEAFVHDRAPDAYERLVDRLLASPHFGERWGRHWLDLTRFAESDGYENDNLRPTAWLWRDWVIAAFNRDLPFDQFTIEQLAGDLLPGATAEQKIATGLHRNTLWNSAASGDKEEFRTRAVKDRAETTALVWMGLTLGCAQCHSHKYDPISQREYYQLYAFFNNTDHTDVPASGGKRAAQGGAGRRTSISRGNFLNRARSAAGDARVPAAARATRFEADRLDPRAGSSIPPTPDSARRPTTSGSTCSARDRSHAGKLRREWHSADALRSCSTGRGGVRASEMEPKTVAPHGRAVGTYRQASRHRPELAASDPDNTLPRQNRFRVEAEIVRARWPRRGCSTSNAAGRRSCRRSRRSCRPGSSPTRHSSSRRVRGIARRLHPRAAHVAPPDAVRFRCRRRQPAARAASAARPVQR
jgi:hypothetical protein